MKWKVANVSEKKLQDNFLFFLYASQTIICSCHLPRATCHTPRRFLLLKNFLPPHANSHCRKCLRFKWSEVNLMVNRHLPYKHHQVGQIGGRGVGKGAVWYFDYLHNAKTLKGRESVCVWSAALVSISMVSYLHSIYFECLFVCMKQWQLEGGNGRGRGLSFP